MIQHPQPRTKTQRQVAAHRCAHCGRELPTGQGTEIPFIGPVGPECVRKYGSLVAAIEQANGMECYEWDQGSVRLAHHVLWDLRGAGVAVAVVDVKPGVKALEVRGLSRKPRKVVASFAEVRERFEQRLGLAAAEREETGWVA
ncbi:hypothetical protein [Deinococcus radiophilus]|uniref:Uncharacterized protein n=1 Tax=Deinococcus radiophilus TaxID=32062 RepID=A0A431W0Q7_9DEIO|nr:hypothetical protein [Deinococcus radiophilus]RTR29038.1 hypothetical protein EJ104_04125 [Deinococcus radiophilus]UFA49622.1 hypothetical protein LMT64_06870 [Deinococcus radiophilus]